jgi:hypothetical protein
MRALVGVLGLRATVVKSVGSGFRSRGVYQVKARFSLLFQRDPDFCRMGVVQSRHKFSHPYWARNGHVAGFLMVVIVGSALVARSRRGNSGTR